MKEKMYKLFLTLIVCLSLGSGPIVQNEVLDEVEREKELEEIRKKKFPNFFRDIHNS